MNKIHKKGIGQYLDKNIPFSKEIINRINYYYSIMEEKERIWFKKNIAGIKTTGHNLLFYQEEGYYDEANREISISQNSDIEEVCYIFFHEIGHYIDSNFNKKISNTAIKILIKELKRKNIKNIREYIRSFEYDVRFNSGLLFDSLCIYYKISPFGLCLGHDKKYYAHDREYGAGLELFAEFFALKLMKNKINIKQMEIFKKEFPKTFYFLNSKINKFY